MILMTPWEADLGQLPRTHLLVLDLVGLLQHWLIPISRQNPELIQHQDLLVYPLVLF